MAQRKYTLPRHTNLATQGSRIAAFLVDFAIALAFTFAFVFGCFQFVFQNKTSPLEDEITKQRIDSHLFFKKDNNELGYYNDESDNSEFLNALGYFYTVYIPYEEVDANEPVILEDGTSLAKKDYFTIEWFNKEVLQIDDDGKALFEYQKSGEEDLKDALATIKSDAEATSVNTFLQYAWIEANNDLSRLSSFKKLVNESNFYYSLEFVLSSLIGFSLAYILMPYIFKKGRTLGKKVFKLCLADSDGYQMHNSQLFLRIVPTFVVLLAFLIPIWNSLVITLLVPLIIFLVSFALSMASPKRMSLHDFVARTIVVDERTSILFSDSVEEEAYIAKEDNIELDNFENVGEEPKLKYEK